MRHWDRPRVRTRPLFLALAALLLLGLPRAGWAARVTRVEAQRGGIALAGPGVPDLRVNVFPLADPPRLILDLEGAALARGLSAELPLRLPGVTRARLAQFSAAPDVARIVLDLRPGAAPPQLRLAPGARPDELLLLLQPPGPVTLTAPVVAPAQGAWVVRIPGVGYLPHRTGELENPPRIFLDFTNAEVPASSGRNFVTGPIRQVRLGRHAAEGEPPVARVAIELRASQAYAESTDGSDLLLSFRDSAQPEAPPPATPRLSYDVPGPPLSYDVPLPPTLRGRRIVVDPGHGGGDPGAQWNDDTESVNEDVITYDLGLRLTHLLRAAGAEVIVTRQEGDAYLRPLARAKLANELQPEAFVSIHCNSCATPSETARGTTVYFGHDDSIPLARAVQEELSTALGTRDRGIEREIFTVIDKTTCPAILVETAFMSNDGDRRLLTDPDARERAAEALLRGLQRFFADPEKGSAR